MDPDFLEFIVQTSPLIKELSLSECCLMPYELINLATMISKLPRLKFLDLSANHITGPGMCIEKEYCEVEGRLTTRYKAVKNLEHFNKDFYHLISVIEKSALKKIDLSDNPLGEVALKFFNDEGVKNQFLKKIVIFFE